MLFEVATVEEFLRLACRYLEEGREILTFAQYARRLGCSRQWVNQLARNNPDLLAIAGPGKLRLVVLTK